MKILLIGPIEGYGPSDAGYGNNAKSIAFILQRMKDLQIIESFNIVNTLSMNQKDLENTEEYDLGILIFNPNSLLNLKDYTILKELTKTCKKRYLNILWETTPLPKKWAPLWDNSINFIDGFIASSSFVCEMLKKVTKKSVYYYPIYMDSLSYQPCNIFLKENEKIFTVLYVGQNTKIKGFEDSVLSFCRAFDGYEDVQFIIKGFQLSQNELPMETIIKTSASCNMSLKTSPIYLLDQKLSNEEMIILYQNCSCLLFLSRGEGFGLPAAEAMLCGLPIIYTDWSALREVAESETNYPVKYTLDEAHSMFQYGYEEGTQYAVPLISEAIKGLRKLYNKWKLDKKQYYLDAQKNREIILDKFNEQKTIDSFKEILEELK